MVNGHCDLERHLKFISITTKMCKFNKRKFAINHNRIKEIFFNLIPHQNEFDRAISIFNQN